MQIPIQYPLPQSPYPTSKNNMFGFSARMFPLFGAVIATITIVWTYLVARSKYPHDIKPFPYTDITHTAIKYPQYVIFRIGMMVTPVLFCISFQILKNFIMIKSFEIRGVEQRRVRHFGPLSIICCLCLCLSTSTISDGKDMDWTAHSIGATSFFILAMYMCVIASKIYRQLYYMDRTLCTGWSFLFKKYNNWVLVLMLALTMMDNWGWVDIGSFVQWGLTFYLIGYFATLYSDFRHLDVMMERKKGSVVREIGEELVGRV